MSEAYLAHSATTEARSVLVDYLRSQAEEQAVGSRDFGRGYAQAVAVLAAAPVQCHSCTPPHRIGETVACPDCGSLWRVYQHGMSWVAGGTPVAQANP